MRKVYVNVLTRLVIQTDDDVEIAFKHNLPIFINGIPIYFLPDCKESELVRI